MEGEKGWRMEGDGRGGRVEEGWRIEGGWKERKERQDEAYMHNCTLIATYNQ